MTMPMCGRRVVLMGLAAAVLMGFGAAPLAAQEASSLDVSEATNYIGEWVLSIQGPQGAQSLDLSVKDVSGKVGAELNGDFGLQRITDISKAGDNLVLNYEADAQGQTFPVALTLMPDGENLTVKMEVAGGQFTIDGTGAKK